MQDELRTFLGYDIQARGGHRARRDSRRLERYYADEHRKRREPRVTTWRTTPSWRPRPTAIGSDGPIDLTSVEALADSAPVRKLLNMVLLMAIHDHASDLHFEPFEDEFRIRIKADGVLYEMVPPPRHLAFAITTRIKVMANLDIAERRLPQDGRIELTVGGHPVDLRVSVLPTMFGESVVMRVLDRSVRAARFEQGRHGRRQRSTSFREVINKPNGIVLVTGPTGSGKTTTLYSALSELNTIEDKLITTEDPVEYDIDGIVQVPIDAAIGNTFAQCLRAILRQDPDKILVGEIRDLETAEIAVQASLTGTWCSARCTPTTRPARSRGLRDMGVPPFLITATVEAILAQRLVRRICTQCREEVTPAAEMLADLELTPADIAGKKFYRGKGCEACNNTRLQRPRGLVRADDHERRPARHDHAQRLDRRDCATPPAAIGMVTLRDAGMQCRLRRHHDARRSRSRNDFGSVRQMQLVVSH